MIETDALDNSSSIIHGLEPRVKIVSAVFYSIQIAISYSFACLMVSVLVGFILTRLAGLRLGDLAKKLKVLFGFLLLIWVIMPLTYQGDATYQFGGMVYIYQAGIEYAGMISLKTIAILFIMISLLSTNNVAVLGHAMGKLGVPKKLVLLILLTYRYIFVLEKEYHRLKRAAEIRGFKPGTNVHTYKTIAYLFGMVVVRAVERAERINWAMKCRGFNGNFYSLERFSFQKKEAFYIVFTVISLIGLAYLEWGVTRV